MFFFVHFEGWVLFAIAAFSAGKPKASQPIGWKIFSKHRMDSDDVVTGAASIIAKVNRDWAMERLSEDLGIDLLCENEKEILVVQLQFPLAVNTPVITRA